MPVLVSSSSIYFIQKYEALIAVEDPVFILGFYILASLTMAFALTPTTFIAILSGFFFKWTGLVAILLAYPLAAVIGLLLGRFFYKKWGEVPFFKQEKYQKWLSKISEKPFQILVFARLSPILPFAMINLVLGQLQLNWATYIFATMVGMLPRTLLFFWTGMQARDIWKYIQKPEDIGPEQIFTIFLIVVSTVGLYWAIRRIGKTVGSV